MIKHEINGEMPVIEEVNHHFGGKQYIYTFRNGYGVSVVPEFEYVDSDSDITIKLKPIKGIFECAVLLNNDLCYETAITDDVVRNCNHPMVHDILEKVQRL